MFPVAQRPDPGSPRPALYEGVVMRLAPLLHHQHLSESRPNRRVAREQLVISLSRGLAHPLHSPSSEAGAPGGEVATLGADVISEPL